MWAAPPILRGIHEAGSDVVDSKIQAVGPKPVEVHVHLHWRVHRDCDFLPSDHVQRNNGAGGGETLNTFTPVGPGVNASSVSAPFLERLLPARTVSLID